MKPPSAFELPFPAWRVGQQRAIRAIQNARTTFTVLQGPTGTGKTAIALGVVKQHQARALTLTATRVLQDQYQQVASWLDDIRGMSNYRCLAAMDEFKDEFKGRIRETVTCEEGPCRLDMQCSLKDAGCVYYDTYRSALASATPSTSYAYWLASRRYGRGLGSVSLLICDEAHDAAEQIAKACQLRVPKGELRGVKVPRTAKEWTTWASAELTRISQDSNDIVGRLRVRTRKERLEHLIQYLDGSHWAWDDDGKAFVFEPIDVRRHSGLLFGGVPKVVLMSATITPATVAMLGIDEADVTYHQVPMRFPVEHRPVYLLDGGRIDYRATPDTLAWWMKRIDQILAGRADRKGIIHTVSYERQQYIYAHSQYQSRMIVPRSSREFQYTLSEFKQLPPESGAILVSPSVMTGVDFPYSDAEYQIISKVPFPSTKHAIMRQRCKRIPNYRDIVTAQALQQATGRIVRAEDDRGETFIVDEHMKWFVKNARQYFAAWFLEAMTTTRRIPPAPPLVATSHRAA